MFAETERHSSLWTQEQYRLVYTTIPHVLPYEIAAKHIWFHVLNNQWALLPEWCNTVLSGLRDNRANPIQHVIGRRTVMQQAFGVIRILAKRCLEQCKVTTCDRSRPRPLHRCHVVAWSESSTNVEFLQPFVRHNEIPDNCAFRWFNALNLETTKEQITFAFKSRITGTVLKQYGLDIRTLKEKQAEWGAEQGSLMALREVLPPNSVGTTLTEYAMQRRITHLYRECIKLQRGLLSKRAVPLTNYFRMDDKHQERLRKGCIKLALLMAKVREHNFLARVFFE